MSKKQRKKISEVRIKNKLSKGKNNPNWKGGKILISGYVYIYSHIHPNKTKDGYVCEHRLVMEEFLNRYLTKKEIIHHKNEIKTDNRIENLELYESCGKHTVLNHMKKDKFGRFSK